MKERPIIFGAESVRVILDGRKTQTRRVVKPQPERLSRHDARVRVGKQWHSGPISYLVRDVLPRFACPFGRPGDRLWVRETFALESSFNVDDYLPPFANHPVRRYSDEEWGEWWEQPHYRATDPTPDLAYEDSDDPECRWKPSIFMPRWASRITLEVTGVRVERLQEITVDDATAEGADHDTSETSDGPRAIYRRLWDSINAERGYGWEKNPWVWVIGFRTVTGENLQPLATQIKNAALLGSGVEGYSGD